MSRTDRRKAIVQAALPLFARKGFAETTTKDLARAAGISEPILYRHFPSKEALYLEILDWTCQATDPLVRKLAELRPSTKTLIHLVDALMRAMILGIPAGEVDWNTRHRLMLNSVLADGAFARLLYRNRFEKFCKQIEQCLEVAVACGDAVRTPLSRGNRARFAHHIGAWVALVALPQEPVIDYQISRERLLRQVVWFALRGMGVTDAVLNRECSPDKGESTS